MNALDIDWSVLRTEPQTTKPAPTSALKRFTAASIFSRIGISRQFAGEKLFRHITNLCQRQLEEELDEKEGSSATQGIEQGEGGGIE